MSGQRLRVSDLTNKVLTVTAYLAQGPPLVGHVGRGRTGLSLMTVVSVIASWQSNRPLSFQHCSDAGCGWPLRWDCDGWDDTVATFGVRGWMVALTLFVLVGR